ncbi:hypothetical protein L1887_62008 [Cichorium endivia]|nr:hypothetical protein L1887_62008 [Cichorium endivia]
MNDGRAVVLPVDDDLLRHDLPGGTAALRVDEARVEPLLLLAAHERAVGVVAGSQPPRPCSSRHRSGRGQSWRVSSRKRSASYAVAEAAPDAQRVGRVDLANGHPLVVRLDRSELALGEAHAANGTGVGVVTVGGAVVVRVVGNLVVVPDAKEGHTTVRACRDAVERPTITVRVFASHLLTVTTSLVDVVADVDKVVGVLAGGSRTVGVEVAKGAVRDGLEAADGRDDRVVVAREEAVVVLRLGLQTGRLDLERVVDLAGGPGVVCRRPSWPWTSRSRCARSGSAGRRGRWCWHPRARGASRGWPSPDTGHLQPRRRGKLTLPLYASRAVGAVVAIVLLDEEVGFGLALGVVPPSLALDLGGDARLRSSGASADTDTLSAVTSAAKGGDNVLHGRTCWDAGAGRSMSRSEQVPQPLYTCGYEECKIWSVPRKTWLFASSTIDGRACEPPRRGGTTGRHPNSVAPEGEHGAPSKLDHVGLGCRSSQTRRQLASLEETIGNIFVNWPAYPLNPRPAPMKRQLKPRRAATGPTRASDRCVVRANVYSSTGVAFVDSAWLGLAFLGPGASKAGRCGRSPPLQCAASDSCADGQPSRVQCADAAVPTASQEPQGCGANFSCPPSLSRAFLEDAFFYFFFYQQFSRSSGRQANPHRG